MGSPSLSSSSAQPIPNLTLTINGAMKKTPTPTSPSQSIDHKSHPCLVPLSILLC
ncbi:hypothetical protein HanRHA438_Chr03g0098221 [Helianthus annuus]|nr:hypothetical protein HanIR_Chr12g0611181 [Helianthus annuus]KAJ0933620.1 hypothetical protein HanRHA438_Chr03g0098221 [Helianthus annuus]